MSTRSGLSRSWIAVPSARNSGLLRIEKVALLPAALQTIAGVLPFYWMLAFPIELLLGRLTPAEAMRGLGRRMPLSMAAMVVAGLALVGVPGTTGFISKWVLVQAALERILTHDVRTENSRRETPLGNGR